MAKRIRNIQQAGDATVDIRGRGSNAHRVKFASVTISIAALFGGMALGRMAFR